MRVSLLIAVLASGIGLMLNLAIAAEFAARVRSGDLARAVGRKHCLHLRFDSYFAGRVFLDNTGDRAGDGKV